MQLYLTESWGRDGILADQMVLYAIEDDQLCSPPPAVRCLPLERCRYDWTNRCWLGIDQFDAR